MMGEIRVWIKWRALRSTELVFAGNNGTYGYIRCIGIYWLAKNSIHRPKIPQESSAIHAKRIRAF
jgi:hypothetical protein